MTRPNESLMRHYGTEVDFQEKEAGLSPLAKRMMLSMAAMQMQRGWDENMSAQRAQAMAMNDAFQQIQAAKLGLTMGNLRYTPPPVFVEDVPYPVPLGMDQGMVRVACEIGRDLARLEKDAGIMAGLAGLAERKAPRLAQGLGRIGGALQAPVHAMQAAPAVQKAVGGLRQGAGAVRSGLNSVAGSRPAQALASGAKSLGRGALRTGLVGAGVLGLGAYALAKPTLSYMSKEQQPANWGMGDYGAPQLAYGVNQYGYPQTGAPFIR